MNKNEERVESPTVTVSEYEAPAIESIVTPNELAREVHYAGVVSR